MYKVQIDSKKYENKDVLKNLSFEIKEGEFITLIGPSGCGKTTLLNILSKLDINYKGRLDLEVEELSFVFQDDRLIPWLSVKENLLLVSKDKNLDQINELLKLVNLEETFDEFPNNLSGGMRKRISFIRAFLNKPKLILLDEAFSSLDYPTAQELKKEFLNLCNKYKSTVIIVSHDISEAILLSHRILFLSKSPSQVILEFKNPNNQEFNMKKIDAIKNELFEKYPNILKGEI
jgi:ABC-type nitrate/sulfonate/bicarbonate transport system ATPase subunit